MSGNIEALKLEMAKLEQEYLDYINKHGFSYRDYISPPPGSFVEKYTKRMAELTKATGVKALDYFKT